MDNFKALFIDPHAPISKAIEILEIELARVVLVVDSQERLLGTITDGDVRRGLLKQLSLENHVELIMFKEPKTAGANVCNSLILELMDEFSLLQMPLIDELGVVVGLETRKQLLSNPRHENPVLLMAGGFGKRLHPLTKDTPKPLLKVGKKPILEMILENFIKAGFYRFYISTHYKSEAVKQYFGDGSKWSVTIEYIHEDEPLGTAGVLGLIPKDMPNLPLILMNGDLLTKANFNELLTNHLGSNAEGTICVREYDFQVPYGVVKADGQSVLKIEEKPVYNFFVNAGIYVLNPSICSLVKPGSYQDMPALLQLLIEEKHLINMFPIHESWLDIGHHDDFARAQTVAGEYE